MHVLILGAKGMLGSMLVKAFSDSENQVSAWDFEDCDITNAEETKEKIIALHPEVIINAAAYTNVDEAEEKKELAFSVNQTAVANIAAAAKKIGAVVVHYSTDYIFQGKKEEGYTEDDESVKAVNVYGASKRAGEIILKSAGIPYYIIRTAWLYGPNGKNFVTTMLTLAQTHKELKVVNDQHGGPTYTKDVAYFTKKLLRKNHPSGVYHAVNAGHTTWYEFAKEIFQIAGKEVNVIPVTSAEFPRPAKRPMYSILNQTKGPSMRPWQEALKEFITTNAL